MRPSVRLEGPRRLLAEKISSMLSRYANLPSAPKPSPARILDALGNPLREAARILALVEAARAGEEATEAIASISWWTSASSRIAPEYPLAALKPSPEGFASLATAILRHSSRGDYESLATLLTLLAGELSRPCRVDAVLEDMIEVLEARMKKLGFALGVGMPLLFLATLLYSPAAALGALAAAAILWIAVRATGVRLRGAVLEAAWRACRLDEHDILDALSGRDLPSMWRILGIEPST